MKTPNLLFISLRLFSEYFFGKLHFSLLLVLLIPLTFTQCTKDSVEPDGKGFKISTRTCEPGTYSIIDGRLAFDDDDEYVKTLEFLSCATEGEFADWDREIEIETAGQAYRTFTELICDDQLTTEDYEELKDEYENKVIFSVNSDGEDEVDPLFPFLEDFCNLDGEFQVGDAVIKLVGNKIISITDPVGVDPSTVNGSTQTDTTDGVFVRIFYSSSTSWACCPSKDDATHRYGNGPLKRLKEDYRVFDATVSKQSNPGPFRYVPVVAVRINAKSQKRAGIWPIYWWNCYPVNNLDHELAITFTHDWGSYGITSPASMPFPSDPQAAACEIKLVNVLPAPDIVGWGHLAPVQLNECVTSVNQITTNTEPQTDVFVEIDCP